MWIYCDLRVKKSQYAESHTGHLQYTTHNKDYLSNINLQMHTFQINVLIQSLVSSTCFKHHVFIIRKNLLYMQFYMLWFSCVYVSSLAGGSVCSILKYRAHPLADTKN